MDRELQAARRAATADPADVALAERVRDLERRSGLVVTFDAERHAPNHHPDLVEIAELDEPIDYAFHYLTAWFHKPTGRVFYGEDSGCSCPSPWENDHFRFDGVIVDTSLTELTEASRSAFEARAEGFPLSIDMRVAFADRVKAVWRAGGL